MPRHLGLLTLVALTLAACHEPSNHAASGAAYTDAGLLAEARRIEGLESLAVWQRGELVLEAYFKGGPNDLRDVRSVTKSVASLLVGIALDKGMLPSVDHTIGESLPELEESFGADKAALRLRDLLTMSTGLQWDERQPGAYHAWWRSDDPIRHYLGRPRITKPGTEFAYASGASHLLGLVLERESGTSVPEFARKHLFVPLDVKRTRWEQLSDGSTNVAAGLRLRTRDLVRIGRLVLQRGAWGEGQIVSPAWIEASTSAHIALGENLGYGYQWWVQSKPLALVVAVGFAGQNLVVAPERDTVIVTTCRRRLTDPAGERQAAAVRRFLRDRLVPAVLSAEGSTD